MKKVKDSYLKKELKRITKNKKLNRVLKKLDKLTAWRKVNPKEKKMFKINNKPSAKKTAQLLDPDMWVIK